MLEPELLPRRLLLSHAFQAENRRPSAQLVKVHIQTDTSEEKLPRCHQTWEGTGHTLSSPQCPLGSCLSLLSQACSPVLFFHSLWLFFRPGKEELWLRWPCAVNRKTLVTRGRGRQLILGLWEQTGLSSLGSHWKEHLAEHEANVTHNARCEETCSPGYPVTYYVVKDDHKLLTLLPPHSKCWYARHVLPHWFMWLWGRGPARPALYQLS